MKNQTKRMEDLRKQLEFFRTVDRMKTIFRQAWITDKSRTENDAEHSWHVALLAMLFADRIAEKNLNLERILRMLLIHDIVEVEAGDTYAFDVNACKDKKERECKAADHLFGLLPEEQGAEFKALWLEFDEEKTPEARFAVVMDHVHPFLLNYYADGKSWVLNKLDTVRLKKRLETLETEFPELNTIVEEMLQDARQRGLVE